MTPGVPVSVRPVVGVRPVAGVAVGPMRVAGPTASGGPVGAETPRAVGAAVPSRVVDRPTCPGAAEIPSPAVAAGVPRAEKGRWLRSPR